MLLKERSGIITVPKPTPDPSHGDRSRDRIQSGDPSRGPRSRSRGRRSRSRERRHRSFSRERGRRSWSRDRAHGRVRSRSPDWSRESDRFPPGLDDVIVLDDYNMDAAEGEHCVVMSTWSCVNVKVCRSYKCSLDEYNMVSRL